MSPSSTTLAMGPGTVKISLLACPLSVCQVATALYCPLLVNGTNFHLFAILKPHIVGQALAIYFGCARHCCIMKAIKTTRTWVIGMGTNLGDRVFPPDEAEETAGTLEVCRMTGGCGWEPWGEAAGRRIGVVETVGVTVKPLLTPAPPPGTLTPPPLLPDPSTVIVVALGECTGRTTAGGRTFDIKHHVFHNHKQKIFHKMDFLFNQVTTYN